MGNTTEGIVRRRSTISKARTKLNEKVYKIILDAANHGLPDHVANLGYMNVDDEMIPELCEWLASFDSQIKYLKSVSKFFKSFSFSLEMPIFLYKITKKRNRLHHNLITSKGASNIFNTITDRKLSISSVNLFGNQLDDDCIEALGKCIVNNKSISCIKIGYNNITDKGIESLANIIVDTNSSLTLLSVWNSKKITDKSIPYFKKIIERTLIKDIDVEDTMISQNNFLAIPLAYSMLKNGSDSISLPKKSATDDDILKICEGFRKFNSNQLKEIDLHNNEIRSEGASRLFDVLVETGINLEKINLSENHLDDECIPQLCNYSNNCPTLKCIYLNKNEISDEGVTTLTDCLSGNRFLKEIYLSENEGITQPSIEHLIKLARNSYIEHIGLSKSISFCDAKKTLNNLLEIPIEERNIEIQSRSKSAAKTS